MRLQGTEFKIMHAFGSTLTNEITGNRIQNNTQSAVLVVAVTGCCTEGLENASFLAEHRLRCRLRTRRGNFNHIWELSTISSWTLFSKKLLNGPCLRVFQALVSRNRARCSAQFLEYVSLRMYFGILSN